MGHDLRKYQSNPRRSKGQSDPRSSSRGARPGRVRWLSLSKWSGQPDLCLRRGKPYRPGGLEPTGPNAADGSSERLGSVRCLRCPGGPRWSRSSGDHDVAVFGLSRCYGAESDAVQCAGRRGAGVLGCWAIALVAVRFLGSAASVRQQAWEAAAGTDSAVWLAWPSAPWHPLWPGGVLLPGASGGLLLCIKGPLGHLLTCR